MDQKGKMLVEALDHLNAQVYKHTMHSTVVKRHWCAKDPLSLQSLNWNTFWLYDKRTIMVQLHHSTIETSHYWSPHSHVHIELPLQIHTSWPSIYCITQCFSTFFEPRHIFYIRKITWCTTKHKYHENYM